MTYTVKVDHLEKRARAGKSVNYIIHDSVSNTAKRVGVLLHRGVNAQDYGDSNAATLFEQADAVAVTTRYKRQQALATLKAAAANFDPEAAAIRLDELNTELKGIVDGTTAEGLKTAQVVKNFHLAVKRIERTEIIVLYLLSELWKDNIE